MAVPSYLSEQCPRLPGSHLCLLLPPRPCLSLEIYLCLHLIKRENRHANKKIENLTGFFSCAFCSLFCWELGSEIMGKEIKVGKTRHITTQWWPVVGMQQQPLQSVHPHLISSLKYLLSRWAISRQIATFLSELTPNYTFSHLIGSVKNCSASLSLNTCKKSFLRHQFSHSKRIKPGDI